MKRLIKVIVSGLLLLFSANTFGQIEKYNFKRPIIGAESQWHKIMLPDDLFSKTQSNLSDIRIFGVSDNNDTIETPYLLRLTKEKIISNRISFEIINTSYNEGGKYFTFEVPTQEPINQIDLDFEQQNFDWKIGLQASTDQLQWFTVVDDYRILSIRNDLTNYQFTKISFPSTKHRFFRLQVKGGEQPVLRAASLSQNEKVKGNTKSYDLISTIVKENKEQKQTEIKLSLKHMVPISALKIDILDTIDYYRSMTIQYLSDSVKTDKGWYYNYSTLSSEILSSVDKRTFDLGSVKTSQLKIVIQNNDNMPLSIGTTAVSGYLHELVVRFTELGHHFLVYGNDKASSPQYDIAQFEDKIPLDPTSLSLGEEVIIEKPVKVKEDPLFESEIWLWVVLILIIGVLGWFSFKMIVKS